MSKRNLIVAANLTVLLCGCAGNELPTKVVFGTVRIGTQTPTSGQIRFVPVEVTPGPASAAPIIDGRYRIDARGGVPLGKHRIEVDARKKTGRQFRGYNGREMQLLDETVSLAAPVYATAESPLIREVTSASDGQIDIEIPSP